MKIWILLMFTFLSSCISTDNVNNKDQVVISMANTIKKQFAGINHMTIEEYLDLKKSNIPSILVDVRNDNERLVSYIPGSISQSQFEKNKKSYKNYHIVAYCTIGQRSSEYAQKLKAQGFSLSSNLQESILGWTHRELPLENKDGPTTRVHVYDDPWNLTHKGYQGVTE